MEKSPERLPESAEQFAARLIDELDLDARARAGAREWPYVALNMISTADGRATLSGRSGAIGDDADKHLFLGLRTLVDGVMAGAGTVRAEGYHRLIRDPAARAQRQGRGLAPEPLACIVSGRLALDGRVPLLAEPEAHVAIVTSSQTSLPDGCRAQIEYVRSERNGQLDLASAMHELRTRFEITTLLCEGGPHLNANLLAAGLVDELFLSLAPTLAGGDATSESLRIVSGVDLEPPVAMELLSSHEYESHLFLRYKINH